MKVDLRLVCRVLIACGALALIQLCRMGLRSFVFLFFERTIISDTLFSSIFMIVVTAVIIIVFHVRQISLSFFPKRFTLSYRLFTGIVALLFFSGILFMAGDIELILFMFYGALITPLFEEILFRGALWQSLNFKKEQTTYLVTTVLFGFWHLGYFDTVLWRTSLLFPTADIVHIMIGKVLIGLIIGLFVGALRYRNGNVYSSFLLHCLINTVGK